MLEDYCERCKDNWGEYLIVRGHLDVDDNGDVLVTARPLYVCESCTW